MIDYRTEIPFQKLAPAGFHDTSEEIVASKNQKFDPVMLHRLEAERRCTHPEPMCSRLLASSDSPTLVPVLSLCQRIHACTCRDREEAKQRRKDKEVLKKMKKVGLPQAIANAAKVRQPNTALCVCSDSLFLLSAVIYFFKLP